MFDEEIIEAIKAKLIMYKPEELYIYLSYLRWYKHRDQPKELVEVLYGERGSCIVNVEKVKGGVFSANNVLNVHKDTLSEIDNIEKTFITLIKQSQIKCKIQT